MHEIARLNAKLVSERPQQNVREAADRIRPRSEGTRPIVWICGRQTEDRRCGGLLQPDATELVDPRTPRG
jgi:hypothetical protein